MKFFVKNSKETVDVFVDVFIEIKKNKEDSFLCAFYSDVDCSANDGKIPAAMISAALDSAMHAKTFGVHSFLRTADDFSSCSTSNGNVRKLTGWYIGVCFAEALPNMVFTNIHNDDAYFGALSLCSYFASKFATPFMIDHIRRLPNLYFNAVDRGITASIPHTFSWDLFEGKNACVVCDSEEEYNLFLTKLRAFGHIISPETSPACWDTFSRYIYIHPDNMKVSALSHVPENCEMTLSANTLLSEL